MTTKITKKLNTSATKIYNLAIDTLVLKYSDDYEKMQDYGIKDLTGNSINIFEKQILEVLTELNIPLTTSPVIHEPRSIVEIHKDLSKHGHISRQYNTIELQFAGGVFYIRYASIDRMKSSCTASKESLFIHCGNSLHKYKKFPMTSKPNDLMEYNYVLCQIINDIKDAKVDNVYESDVEVLLEELDYELSHFSKSSNKSIRKTILNALSGGNFIKNKQINKEYTPYRNDVYHTIRNKVGELAGTKRVDNVYPVDIIYVKKGFEKTLPSIIENIDKLSTKEEKITEFYKYFMNMNDYDEGIRLPIFGISLKQELACGGKGKTAVGKQGNVTEYEQTQLNNKSVLKLIHDKRLVLSKLNIPKVSYKIYGKMDEFENTLSIMDKYSAAKLVVHMFANKTTYNELVEYLEDIIVTCAGLGKNPAYSKIIMNERGLHEKVKCVNYEKNYKLKISKSSKIEIMDKNSSNVIDILFLLDTIDPFNGKSIKSPAKLEVRTNNSNSKQSTIELKYL